MNFSFVRPAPRLLVLAGMIVFSSATLPSVVAGQAATAAPATTKAGNNAADVHFMAGMIPHHAQAVLIAGWAPTHGARKDIAILCERIVVAQQDEIRLMQFWLREHGEPVPDATSTHMKMDMNGMQHDMLMPGMLNDEQLAALDKARGADFDRLFLQAMIGHHEGAITMVDALFATPGAGNDDVVYRFASDVYADQSTEIERMNKMLASVPSPRSTP